MPDDTTDYGDNDIAIVGLALRVPGATDPETFFSNLRRGVESIRTYTDEELRANGETEARLAHPNYVRAAAELPGMEMFDGEFFGFGPKESAILDPQHRAFLECAWEALENAGHPPERFDGPIGVYAGCGMGTYFYVNLCSNRELVDTVGIFLLRHTGNDKDFLATRLSYVLDLKGPSVNVQTACSTSLVAVHHASQSLLSRECDMALAGGVTIELPHRRGYIFEDGEILSPDGHCHAFDHRAAGTVFGSGVGVVVLRRLEDAVRDGDHIHAVIKATAVNNDGASKAGYLAPSVNGQAAAIVEAHTLANVDVGSIGYVECHGTGTYLGDPIEVEAMAQAFKQGTPKKGFCRIGSVKTNIGHLDTAAGVVGLIKTALSLEHELIPPSLGYERPNPTIDFANTAFVVNDRPTPWPRGKTKRRAGVNSLGVGGTNCHAVLEEAPARARRETPSSGPYLLTLSARNRTSLDAGAKKLATYLEAHPERDLADVAYTLRVGRRLFDKRRVLAVRDREEAIRLLREPDPRRVFNHEPLSSDAPEVVFMFPGGGAQYLGMARGLYAAYPEFRRVVDEGFGVLREKVSFDPEALLFHGAQTEETRAMLERPSVQLPLTLVIEVALARLWMSFGVKPAALIGHSMGENAAACVAGVLTFEDAIGLVHLRGTLFDTITGGGMLSVALGADALRPLLGDALDLAVVNAPELSVASGPKAALDALAETLSAREVESTRIRIDIAAHSRMLEPILAPFEAFLRGITLRKPTIPFVSNHTGRFITDEEATSPAYWVRHLRGTILFSSGLETLAAKEGRVYLEVGPGRTLGSLAKLTSAIPPQAVLASLRHEEEHVDDATFFACALGRMAMLGVELPIDRLDAEDAKRVPLSTYAFAHQRYFIEPAAQTAAPVAKAARARLPDVGAFGYRPTWRRSAADVLIDGARPDGRYLVFLDDAGVGHALVEKLRARGASVVVVTVGDAFARHGDDAYVIAPERGREGYTMLFAELVKHGAWPTHIVHMWLLTRDRSHRPGSSFLHRNLERGFHGLFALAQALLAEGTGAATHLLVVSNGMHGVGDAAPTSPEKATALGPVLVLPHEAPFITCSAIDLDLVMEASHTRRPLELVRSLARSALDPSHRIEQDFAGQLLDELDATPENTVVAYRSGARWVRTYVADTLEPKAPPLREKSVVLVTGGLGGIALTLSKALADACAARLVLVSRRAFPPNSEWAARLAASETDPSTRDVLEKLLALEAAGSEVLVVAADVSNVEDMRRVVRAARTRFGAIHGVIHAAGVVKDALVATKTERDIEQVFAPKVHGTLVLDEVLEGEALDFFVVFSSTSAITGPAGQVDYVAANAFLDAFAEERTARTKQRTLSLAWGIWNDVGMAFSALHGGKVAPRQGTRTKAPLFDGWFESGSGRRALRARWSSKTEPMLDEHRTADGRAIVPGTGYIDTLAQARAEYGETGPYEVKDLLFLRPIAVPDDETREVRVRLSPSREGYEAEIRSAASAEGVSGFVLNAQARIRPAQKPRPAPLDLTAIEARCTRVERNEDGAPLRSAQEHFLRFGPRWQVLRETRLGVGEAMAKLALASALADDVRARPMHPGLFDLATGFAMHLIDGYREGEALWVPVSYGTIRVHAPLEANLVSVVTNAANNRAADASASFDVVITDERGQVLVEVEGFSIRRLDGTTLGELPLPRRAELEVESEPTDSAPKSPAERRLGASLALGIKPDEGAEAFLRVLASGRGRAIVTSMPLSALIEDANADSETASTSSSAKFARPELDSAYVPPSDDIERSLVGFWEELLGVEGIGVADGFFELGGHSLIAVRLFAKVKKTFGVDLPISVLFEAPTIARCAVLIRRELGDELESAREVERPRYMHLVAMHPGEGRPARPFFLVAGMFGNVLNLRHLGLLLGDERPFYALQARGLFGDVPPHETFEEMAADYIAELRTVQPHGPYLLGGFSGGGITAFEMAQQLRAAGEEVALVVMLDTPLPVPEPLSLRDRIALQAIRLKEDGPAYIGSWAQRRVTWELERIRNRGRETTEVETTAFHDAVIEASFRAALGRYTVRGYDGRVVLYRPKLDARYKVAKDRAVSSEREYVHEDNRWTGHVRDLVVHEVPGDHDSMVLEPNVRVLAARMREAIAEAEREIDTSRALGRAAE